MPAIPLPTPRWSCSTAAAHLTHPSPATWPTSRIWRSFYKRAGSHMRTASVGLGAATSRCQAAAALPRDVGEELAQALLVRPRHIQAQQQRCNRRRCTQDGWRGGPGVAKCCCAGLQRTLQRSTSGGPGAVGAVQPSPSDQTATALLISMQRCNSPSMQRCNSPAPENSTSRPASSFSSCCVSQV